MLTKLKHWVSSLFCVHQWDIYEERVISVYDTCGFETDEELRIIMKRPPSYHLKKIILRCKKCGDLKCKVFKV